MGTNNKEPPQPGRYLRYAIYGFNDGLVSNLALVAGLSGALLAGHVIILAGLVVMIGAAISMGLGAYLSAKSQNEYYRQQINREKEHVYQIPAIGKHELRDIYYKKGFRGPELERIITTLAKNKHAWLHELAQGTLGLGNQHFDNPTHGGIITFLAFIVGAIVPLVPYIFIDAPHAFLLSLFFSALILFVAGTGKTHYTKRNWAQSGIEMVLIGLLSAAASYYSGRVIGSYLALL